MWALAAVGLPLGAMYGLAALGLVLVYRTTGVLNLAQGAVATAVAFSFHELRGEQDAPLVAALVAALAVAAALGLLTAAVSARVGADRPLAQAVASLGVAGMILGACGVAFGTETVFVTPFLTDVSLSLGDAVVSGQQLLVLGTAVGVAAGVWLLVARTWVGLAVRGTAGDRTAASLVGVPVRRLETVSFVAGSVLAGLAGILLAPLLFLDLTQLSVFFLVKPFAAAAAAGLTGPAVALAAGLAVGVAESVLTGVGSVPGLPELVPLAVVLGALAARRRGLRTVTGPPLATGRADLPGRGGRAPGWALAGAVLVAAPHLSPYQATIVQLGAVAMLLACSHVVVTGWAGQLSLAQPALAGVGAITAANLATRFDLPFPWPLLAAPLATIPLGVLVGWPARRTGGLLLAAVTLVFSAAVSAVAFSWEPFTGGTEGRFLPPPALGNVDLSGPRFTWVTVLVTGAAFAGMRRLGRSRWGAAMVAVRERPRAAAALGVSVRAATLLAFSAAGALGGLAGALSAYQLQAVPLEQYHPLSAVPILALTVVGGVESLWGAVLGGGLHALVPELMRAASAEVFTPLVTPVALLAVLFFRPGGLASLAAARDRPSPSLAAESDAGPASPGAPPAGPVNLARPHAEPVLVVSDLGVRLGAFPAVDGMDLAVAAGEVVALMGPNGAGKTTVFEAISGFAPATGEIVLGGRRMERLAPHRRARAGLGRTFQSGGLFPRLTLRDNLDVALGARRAGRSPVGVLLADAGLGHWADVPACELPPGIARIGEVARALALAPRVVLLDEPAAGLTAGEATDLLDRLRRWRDATGCAVVLIEHDLRVVRGTDRVVVMNGGRLLSSGAPDAVCREPAVVAAYLGPTADADADGTPDVVLPAAGPSTRG